MCPNIGNLDQLHLTLTRSLWTSKQVYAVGSSISCSYGYRASHHKTITCQEDGTWNGTTPTCTRGKVKFIKLVTFVLRHANNFNSIFLKNKGIIEFFLNAFSEFGEL